MSASEPPARATSAGGHAARATSAGERPSRGSQACPACMRRSWLLGALSGPLDYCARDRARLLEVLALSDDELLQALAGRRARELRDSYARFPHRGRRDAGEPECATSVQRICRHCPGYPSALAAPSAPAMLEVAGGCERLLALTGAPVVALLGATAASDYGRAVAASLARGLGASGATVVASLADGIALAAHAGALEVDAPSIAVLGGGLGVACPARMRALYARVTQRGCGVSELPCDCAGRLWGQIASERIVAQLAAVSVVVEAKDTPAQLTGAHVAQALGRVVAAVPGRVSSPLSRGTHALLLEGAQLVRGAQDVLELLGPLAPSHLSPAPAQPSPDPAQPPRSLRAGLRATLERVGAGCDTPARLTRAGEDPCAVLLALSELELMGLLTRGDGGRYVPTEP